LLQHVDESIGALHAEEDGEKRIAVVRAIEHERFHFFIADPIVQLFKLGITKAKLGHHFARRFRRTSSSAISLTCSASIQVWSYVPVVVAPSIGVVVGAVVVGGVSGKTFVEVAFVSADVVEVLSETGTVDVDASRTAEDAPPDELLLVAAEDSNVGAVDVELTKGKAFSM
jgi:hypothetical protein